MYENILTKIKEKKFLVGSRRFFNGIKGFCGGDYDYVTFVKDNEKKHEVYHDRGIELHAYCFNTKEELIQYFIKQQTSPVFVGHFLIPEVCETIGFTFEDLPKIKMKIDKLDSKHSYLSNIYYSYIENGGMWLSESQLNSAYEVYQKSRKNDNKTKRFIVGSTAFFLNFEDFNPKDIDILIIENKPKDYNNFRQTHLKKGKCVFEWKDMTADEFIEFTLMNHDTPMQIGKFLISDFSAYLGLTIEQLTRLKSLVHNLDEKHQYEAIIFNSYLENNSFTLSQEQLIKAYDVYKTSRNLK